MLWEDPITHSCAGFLEIAPGAGLRPHSHPAARHHLYVLRGTCELAILDRVVGAGSYVMVPAGMVHGKQAVGSELCTLFFVDQEENL